MVLVLFDFFTRLLVFYSDKDLITLYPVHLCRYITLSVVFLRLRSEEFLCKQTLYVTHDAHLNTDIAFDLNL